MILYRYIKRILDRFSNDFFLKANFKQYNRNCDLKKTIFKQYIRNIKIGQLSKLYYIYKCIFPKI